MSQPFGIDEIKSDSRKEGFWGGFFLGLFLGVMISLFVVSSIS